MTLSFQSNVGGSGETLRPAKGAKCGTHSYDQRTVLLHYHLLGCIVAQVHHQLKKVHGSEAFYQDVLEMIQKVRQRRPQPEGPTTIRSPNRQQQDEDTPSRSSKNDVRKWSAEITASKETVRLALHEDVKSPERQRVFPHNPTQT